MMKKQTSQLTNQHYAIHKWITILALFVCLYSGQITYASELLTNESFESGPSASPWDETIPPSNWAREAISGGWANWAQEGELEWAYKPDEYSPAARTGTRYITVGAWDSGHGEFSQTVAGSANTIYTFSIYARKGWGYSTIRIGIEYIGQEQTILRSDWQAITIPSTSTWSLHSLEGQPSPIGTEYVRVIVLGDTLRSHNHVDDASLTSEPAGDPEVSIAYSIRNRKHIIDGIGAQVWESSSRMFRVLNELDIDYVRTSSPSAASYAASMGCKVVYLNWAAPAWMLDGNTELQPSYLDDYAAYWGDILDNLQASSVYPEYIELSNEPDGRWNTYISPANYNTLVPLVRAELDTRGHESVGIVGPGLAHFDWESHNLLWLSAMDTNTSNIMAAWSTHTWDDGGICYGGASCLESVWPEFGDTARSNNPTIPFFITEYATKENTFHGITYPHPDEYRDYNASNTVPYAARVYENTLALLNLGANVPFIWQATDQSWETKGWGLIDLNANPKPVFFALKTLLPWIPDGATVLEPIEEDSSIYSGAYLHERQLTIGLANDSSYSVQRTLEIQDVESIQIIEAVAFEMDTPGNPASEIPDVGQIVDRTITVTDDNQITILLPGDSTLTLVLQLTFAPGDADGNGEIDLDDYAMLNNCLAGPNAETSSECLDIFDLDDDQDVDLKDYSAWLLLFME